MHLSDVSAGLWTALRQKAIPAQHIGLSSVPPYLRAVLHPLPQVHKQQTEFNFWKECYEIIFPKIVCLAQSDLLCSLFSPRTAHSRPERTIWPICKTSNYFLTWHLGPGTSEIGYEPQRNWEYLLLRDICPTTKWLDQNSSVPLRIKCDVTDLELYKP